MDLFPGKRQQGTSGLGIESRPLAQRNLARSVADVVAEHAPDEQVDRHAFAPLRDRLHVRSLSDRPLPPPRTAWISARIASAISGAERAPRSRPMGTCTRVSASDVTPSSAR